MQPFLLTNSGVFITKQQGKWFVTDLNYLVFIELSLCNESKYVKYVMWALVSIRRTIDKVIFITAKLL